MLKWQGERRFSLEDDSLEMLNPKELMLVAMGKCSGIVAVMLMMKMHMEPRSVTVEVEGVMEQDAMVPEAGFSAFKETFRVECDPEDADRAFNAVEKTVEKYCGVTQMFKRIAPVDSEIIINGKSRVG